MTGASVRRLVSRSCFSAAAIAFVAALVPSGANAQAPPPRPNIFSTKTQAIGVDYVPDQQGGLTPIKDTFHMQFVTGLSTMSSSNGPTARATVADPGNGVTQGPANGCPAAPGLEEAVPQGISNGGGGFIGNPLLDAVRASNKELQPLYDTCTTAKWPFITMSDPGRKSDNSTEGSLGFGQPNGQLYGEGGAAHAHTGDDGTSSTEATMSGLRIAPVPGGSAVGLPLPPEVTAAITDANGGVPIDTGVFNVGSIQSTTANLFDGPAAVSHAESRLNGVKFIGGLLTIDSITSIADVHFTPDGDVVGTASTTVQGAKMLGHPVTIDDKGVHPDGNSGAPTDLLQQAGLSVRLVGATNGPDAGFMTAQSQGVVVDYTQTVSNAPTLPPPPPNPITQTSPSANGTYFVRYNLASVSSRALARNLTATSGGGTGSSGSRISTLTAVPPSVAGASGHTGSQVTAAASALAPSSDVGGTNTSFLGLDFDLRWLYLAFTLAAFGMCIAPKLVLPARLPARKA